MKLRNKKTGEIWGNAVIESYLCAEGYRMIVKVNKDSILGKHYDSLSALNKDWEDYTPTEPLIKDPKIRKSVRVWAEANDIASVQFDANWRGFRHDNAVITVWEDLPLEDNKIYTITELCGEDEE